MNTFTVSQAVWEEQEGKRGRSNVALWLYYSIRVTVGVWAVHKSYEETQAASSVRTGNMVIKKT